MNTECKGVTPHRIRMGGGGGTVAAPMSPGPKGLLRCQRLTIICLGFFCLTLHWVGAATAFSGIGAEFHSSFELVSGLRHDYIGMASGPMLTLAAVGGYFLPRVFVHIVSAHGYTAEWITLAVISIGCAVFGLAWRNPARTSASELVSAPIPSASIATLGPGAEASTTA